MLEKISQFVHLHEKLVMVVLIIGTLLYGVNKFLDHRAHNFEQQIAVLTSQLEDVKARNSELAQASKQQQAEYQAMVDTLNRQNEKLMTTIAQRNTDLKQHQDDAKTLPIPDVAKRWETLLNVPVNTITPSLVGLTVPEPVARQTVATLEAVPILEANLKDTQQIADNRQTELTKANQVIGVLNAQVSGLNLQIKKEEETCKEQVSFERNKARRGKIKWFVAGFVAGVGSTLAAIF